MKLTKIKVRKDIILCYKRETELITLLYRKILVLLD